MRDDHGTREVRSRLRRAVEAASGRGQAGVRRDVPPLRGTPRITRRPTDLEFEFVNLDYERLRTPSFRSLSPKGMDMVIRCRAEKCGWVSRPFPFDALVFRATAAPHFAYIKSERIYACRAGLAVLQGQGAGERSA